MKTFIAPANVDVLVCEEVLARIREGKVPLDFDASRIEAITIAVLQLLCVAVCNRSLRVLNQSEEFDRVVSRLGLMKLLQSKQHSGATIAANDQSETTGGSTMIKRILTIDDSKTMRDMLLLTLADAGFEVLQAVDGEDGIRVLNCEKVDLVITDINMPKMDGYEVIRRVRAKPEYTKLPILVLTTEAEVDKRNIAREAGASGWMVKPFDPDRLIEAVMQVAA